MAKARAIFEGGGRGSVTGGGLAARLWTGVPNPTVQETVTVIVWMVGIGGGVRMARLLGKGIL